MHDLSAIAGNLLYVMAFGCALVGILAIWKRITDLKATGSKTMIAKSLAAGGIAPPFVVATRAARDLEGELREWRNRAETAELQVHELRDELVVAQQHVLDLKDEAKLDKEDTSRAIAHAADVAVHDYGSALADAVEEAERHWRAGLGQAERDAAWDEHWQQFDEPVRAVIEEQVQWWRSMRRQ